MPSPTRSAASATQNVTITDDALAFLVEACDGDARRALTALEIGVKSALVQEDLPPQPPSLKEGGSRSSFSPLPSGRGAGGVGSSSILFDLELAQDSIQRKVIEFDPTGDSHYDTASAFIKSLRGSDPDAALYWMARMLEGGEDPRFVARRLVIFASEDVGNADPFGLVLANAAWDAVEKVGLPECRINLSHAVTYLATAQKSNASYAAGEAAAKDVKEGRTLPVPLHLRDKKYKGAKEVLGHGVGYKYAHDFAGGWVDQEYIPADVEYYQPTDRGHEAKIKARLEELRKRKQKPEGE